MKNNLMQSVPSLTMPYGKHRGKDIASVPQDYLQWFLGNCKARHEVMAAITEVLNPQSFTVNAPVPVQELSDLAEAAQRTRRTLAAVIEKKNEEENRSKP